MLAFGFTILVAIILVVHTFLCLIGISQRIIRIFVRVRVILNILNDKPTIGRRLEAPVRVLLALPATTCP
uniref:Putative secreted protein n=1 Tax=Anopheles darlingi TaxID=43151 RepID=A0A2M4D701_ANODA